MAKQVFEPDSGAQTSINLTDSITGTGGSPATDTQVFAPVHYAAPQTVTRSDLYISYRIQSDCQSTGPLNTAQALTRIRYSTNNGGAYTTLVTNTLLARDGETETFDSGVTAATVAMPASFDLSNLRVEAHYTLTNTGTPDTMVASCTITIFDSYIRKPYRHIIMAG